MVDWKEVERLRSRGLDWEAIAENPKVKFSAPADSGAPGRALKTLYLARKSQRSRSSRGQAIDAEEAEAGEARFDQRNGRFFIVGLVLALLFGIWSVFAIARPAPFGVLVPFFPYLLAGLVLGGILLAAGFVLGLSDVRMIWKKPVVVGIVLGLIVAVLGGYIALSVGFLNLQPDNPIGGTGWDYAANSMWQDSGKPVVLFIGSAACPFCSASSWAIRLALDNFGSLAGTGYATSSPTDTYASTPEVTLYGSSYSSALLSWHVYEDSNTQSIHVPSLPNDANSYMTAYNTGGSIPFFVVAGTLIHVGSFVDPGQLCVGQQTYTTSSGVAECTNGPYSPSQLEGALTNSTNPDQGLSNAVTAVLTQMYFIEAVFVKAVEAAGLNAPPPVAENSVVKTDLAQLST